MDRGCRYHSKMLQSDNYRTSFGWECNPGDIQGIYAGYRPVYKYAGGRDSGRCTIVEVKAKSGNAKSMKTILKHPEKYHVYDVLKFGDYNIGRQGQILTLPLYMGAFL